MISAAGRFGGQQGAPKAPRGPSCAGMGHQALLTNFLEELRKAQAKSCEQDVEEIKRAGMSGQITGKQEETTRETENEFTF